MPRVISPDDRGRHRLQKQRALDSVSRGPANLDRCTNFDNRITNCYTDAAMFTGTATDRPNPASAPGLHPRVDPAVTLRLPADAYYHLVRTLCLALPPPPS